MYNNAIKKVIREVQYRINVNKKKRKDLNSNNITNWGIIGLGNMANVFAKALSVTSEAKIVAVASRSDEKAKKFADKYGVKKYYSSYEEMLMDKSNHIDVIYIATPLSAHYENIKLAITHGYNVLCEKPIVPTTTELEELQMIASKNRVFLMEGMWMNCLPINSVAQKWILEDKIGMPRYIRIDLSKREVIDFNRAVFSSNEHGGVLFDYGVYAIWFAMMFLKGKINIINSNFLMHEKGFDTDWFITLSDENMYADITISSSYDGDKKAVVFGELGSIVWDSQFNRTNSISCYDNMGNLVDSYSIDYIADGFEYEIKEVQRCIRKNAINSDCVPIERSMEVLSILNQLKAKI